MDYKSEMAQLRQTLNEAGYRYYVLDDPTMSDYEYDHMLRRLDAATCMDLAYNVLMSADISASQRMVRERLQESLGSELAFHTTSILAHCHE